MAKAKNHDNPVQAIHTSDWHVHHAPPALRAAEPDWFKAMGRPIGEVLALANHHQAPILHAGDIFHKATEPPEVVNWLIQKILSSGAKVYAVPGQHDLEHHNYENIKRTSYWTLVEAGAITHCHPERPTVVQHRPGVMSLTLHAFPWRFELAPNKDKAHDFNLDIAMVHKYIWTKETGHAKALEEQMITKFRMIFADYDSVVIGDNHMGWQSGNTFNCGTLMRRRSDEMGYRPSVGILYADGALDRYYLDTSRDHYDETVKESPEEADKEVGLTAFMESLGSLGTSFVDFVESTYLYLETHQPEIAQRVKDRVINIVGKKK